MIRFIYNTYMKLWVKFTNHLIPFINIVYKNNPNKH